MTGQTLTEEGLDALVLAVYRARLDASFKGDADSLLAKVGEKKFRRFAEAYRGAVTETCVQLGMWKSNPPGKKAETP